MRAVFKFFCLSIAFLLFSSCEGDFHFKGIVLDRVSNAPVEGVQVTLILNETDTLENLNNKTTFEGKYIKTDRKGYFEIPPLEVGCTPRCPDAQLLFTKPGFHQEIYTPNEMVEDSMIIYLN